jgi:pyridoxine 5-phosphate synthase
MLHQRLYINVDHIATIRQARRSAYPDPVEGAVVCERAGADGITAHLREDRRHIQDDDVERLAKTVSTVFNLEMACTDEMIGIAERLRPIRSRSSRAARRSPPKVASTSVANRTETAGVTRLNAAGIRTSLFIPDRATVDACRVAGAAAIELHTGAYSHAPEDPTKLRDLRDATTHGASIGLAVHAGHGLTTANVGPVAGIPEIEELNIGHWVVSRAMFVGLADAVRELRAAMDAARATF